MSINEKTSSTNIFISICPNSTRVTSSNYKPFSGWVYEAQMVAFKAGLWKSFLDDAIREEARLSMNNGTGGEVLTPNQSYQSKQL
ncbi:hypothetical protein Bca4012_096310 [Brassica carinata]